ncbi:hypothetical protein BYT27DRAFT_7219553 [Phlegmacium glaucopus]|nr:hypothetical protein BYT27DRAFT_7219553 [Phlegmacium glaucopus]
MCCPIDEQHPSLDQPLASCVKDKEMIELVKRFDKTVMKLLESNPPYKAAKSSSYITFQKRGEPIYDGHYPFVAAQHINLRAPPIQLYNPAFGQFLNDIANKDLEVPTEVIQATACLMNLASAMYESEGWREASLDKELTAAISMAIGKISNADRASADGMVTTEILVGNKSKSAAICIEEDKNEFGRGGSDPSI